MLRDQARPLLGSSPGWDPVAERPVPPSLGMRLAPVFVFAASLVLYLRTLLPGMAFDDWGEMQTVPHVLGIAHPTGYPTYILTAWLFELLPFGSIAFRANLFAAVCVSVALAAMTCTTMRLGVRPTIAAAMAIATGATGTVWVAATVADIDPFHLALMALLVDRSLAWADGRRTRDLALGGLLVGLSLGTHLLTLFVAPFFVVFALWAGRPGGLPLHPDRGELLAATPLQPPDDRAGLPLPRDGRAVPRPVRRPVHGGEPGRPGGQPPGPVVHGALSGDGDRAGPGAGRPGDPRGATSGVRARVRGCPACRDPCLGELPAARALPAGAVAAAGYRGGRG